MNSLTVKGHVSVTAKWFRTKLDECVCVCVYVCVHMHARVYGEKEQFINQMG